MPRNVGECRVVGWLERGGAVASRRRGRALTLLTLFIASMEPRML